MENKDTPSPIEQLKELSRQTEAAWVQVQHDLRDATLELVEVTPEEKMMLYESFWSVHPLILERATMYDPDIAERVFTRFEQIANERRAFEAIQFEEETLPQAKKVAFFKGLLDFLMKYR